MSDDSKRKGGGGGASYRSWSWKNVILTTLCILIIIYVLAGGINQVATGQTIIEWTMEIGEVVGSTLQDIFRNEGPIQVTDQGVYLEGAEPPSGSALE